MSRRTVLLWTGALGVPLATSPLRWWRALVEVSPRRALATRLGGMVADRAAALAVGRAYVGDGADVDALVDAVASSARSTPAALGALSRVALGRAVSAAVDADYDDGVVVVVDGWLLSRTEASICALTTIVLGLKARR